MGRESYRKILEIPEKKEWLKKRVDVATPGQCALHECVKVARDDSFPPRTCIWCAYYHNPVTGDICLPCLATEHLDNFKVEKYAENDERYQYMVEEAKKKAEAAL